MNSKHPAFLRRGVVIGYAAMVFLGNFISVLHHFYIAVVLSCEKSAPGFDT